MNEETRPSVPSAEHHEIHGVQKRASLLKVISGFAACAALAGAVVALHESNATKAKLPESNSQDPEASGMLRASTVYGKKVTDATAIVYDSPENGTPSPDDDTFEKSIIPHADDGKHLSYEKSETIIPINVTDPLWLGALWSGTDLVACYNPETAKSLQHETEKGRVSTPAECRDKCEPFAYMGLQCPDYQGEDFGCFCFEELPHHAQVDVEKCEKRAQLANYDPYNATKDHPTTSSASAGIGDTYDNKGDTSHCVGASYSLWFAQPSYAMTAKALKYGKGYENYCAKGYPDHHAGDEGDEGTALKAFKYSEDHSECSKACDDLRGCKHYTACPGDGNMCYLHSGTNADSKYKTAPARKCQMYFPCDTAN